MKFGKLMTISAVDAVKILRQRGMHITVKRLIDGFESGLYPFGRVIAVGKTGRRTVEIFQRELDEWIEGRICR